MTVETATSKVIANGNGVATSFSFSPVVIFVSTDLVVVKTDNLGNDVTLVEEATSTGYAVVVASYPGTGSVTYPASGGTPLPTGHKLTMRRVLDIEQQTDLENQGGYFPETLETQLDKLVMIDSQQQETLDRALTLEPTVSGVSTVLPKPVADRLLGWNSDATAISNNASAGTLAVSSYVEASLDETTLAGFLTALGVAADMRAFFATANDAAARTELDVLQDVFTTRGDLVRAGASAVAERVALGANGYVLGSDGTDALWRDPATFISTTPRSYLAGYKLANNVADATNDIDIAPGTARDTADTATLTLASALTKQLDAAWAVGSAAGGLDTGSIANGTWHVHAIRRPDTGVVDALFSLAADEIGTFTVTIASPAVVTEVDHGRVNGASVVLSTTGALPTGLTAGALYYVINAAADTYQLSATQGGAAINTSGSQNGVHTAKGTPVLPTNYTQFRRIGSVIRVSAALLAFIQTGDEFLFNAVTLDVSANTPAATSVLRALVVPTGLRVGVIFNWNVKNDGSANYYYPRFSPAFASDQAPALAAAPLIDAGALITGNGGNIAGWKIVTTNRSAQVRSRFDKATDANTNLYMTTIGWFDRRGRDN